MSKSVKANGLGSLIVWEAAIIACVGAEATEAVELRHRPDLYSAKAVGEVYVPVLQFIKAGSDSVRRLDNSRQQKVKMITANFSQSNQ